MIKFRHLSIYDSFKYPQIENGKTVKRTILDVEHRIWVRLNATGSRYASFLFNCEPGKWYRVRKDAVLLISKLLLASKNEK